MNFTPTINQITETALYPDGRFRTLVGIRFVSDSDGSPRMELSGEWVHLLFVKNGLQYRLSICLKSNDFLRDDTTAKLARINSLHRDELLKQEILLSEMAVYDCFDRIRFLDVIVTENPGGETMGQWLRNRCAVFDSAGLKKMFYILTRFISGYAQEKEYAHGRVLPKNLWITPGFSIRLTDYRRLAFSDENGWEETRNKDLLDFLRTALYVYCCASNPGLGRNNEVNNFTDAGQFSVILDRIFSDHSQTVFPRPFISLWRSVSAGKVPADLSLILDDWMADFKLAPLKDRSDDSPDNVLEPLTIVSEYAEGLAIVVSDGKYGFADQENGAAIPAVYDWVSLFDEGFAAVKIGEFYGVINKTGKEILRVIYEDIRWASENGVIIACQEGEWSLFDRLGRRVGEESFDFISDFSCGLAVASREMKSGYIDREAKTVIPFLYDEAYSFDSNETARVVKNSRVFHVDVFGTVIG